MTFPAPLIRAVSSADHMDALSIESDVELLPFIRGMVSFNPSWLRALYRIRAAALRLVGHETGVPQGTALQISLTPGEQAGFFTVEDASDTHWIASASESHLTARLAVLQSPGRRRRYTYRVVTVVHYHNLLGRVYFAVIQPFHFLVVRAMMRHGAGA